MSTSQPSREIYAIDVPEIKQFAAEFRYNFFTPDESINDKGGVPLSAVTKHADVHDSAFVQYSTMRVPRVVKFNFTLPKLADIGNRLTERALRDRSFSTTGEQNGSLIKDNLDKIVNEDFFASNNFTGVNFHDGEIDTKIHELVSGSMEQLMLEEPASSDASLYQTAQRFIPMLPKAIPPEFAYRMFAPGYTLGHSFMVAGDEVFSKTFSTSANYRGDASKTYVDKFYERLKHVSTNAQINTKLFHDLVDKAIKDPTSPSAGGLVSMHKYTKSAKHAANQRFSPAVSENDYKTFVPYVSVKKRSTATHAQKYGSEIVGYIIDKFEVLDGPSGAGDQATKAHSPIVIDSAHTAEAVDYLVKYNTTYCYAARVIAMLTMPAIDDNTGDVATVKVLVSSKPSNKVYVRTVEFIPPPPPGDVNFVWNYELSKLMVTWAMPTTSQRDVKQFQIYRRASIEEPFELQKVYDFDDSAVRFNSNERPDPRVVERIESAVTLWIDDGFDPNLNNTLREPNAPPPPTSRDKGLIYSVCAIDAHGMSSNYSAQFRVWFDLFKNKIVKELVSHTGAPKPYPNMYLEGDLFTDTIKVSGPHSRRMKLYFNPEYYSLYDNDGHTIKVLATTQNGGSYKMQFLNTDSGKGQDLIINIDDRTHAVDNTSFTQNFHPGSGKSPARKST